MDAWHWRLGLMQKSQGRQSHFTTSSFPFHCSLRSTVAGHSPISPLPGPSVTVEDFACDGLTLIMAY